MPTTQTNGRSVAAGVGAYITLLWFPCPVARSCHTLASNTDDNSSEGALSICSPHKDTGICRRMQILYTLRVHTLKNIAVSPRGTTDKVIVMSVWHEGCRMDIWSDVQEQVFHTCFASWHKTTQSIWYVHKNKQLQLWCFAWFMGSNF